MSEVNIPTNDPTAEHLRNIYPSNSKLQPPQETPKRREQRLQKVTTSETIEKKPSIGRRIMNLFISEDTQEIKRYLIDDLIIPSIKSGILSAMEMIFFHRTTGYGYWRPTDYSRTNQKPSTYTYSSRQNRGYVDAGQVQTNGELKMILYKTRLDAERVLSKLYEEINIYGEATVMQYYDASDISSDFTNANWGWKDLSTARIYPVAGGFTIRMPKPIYLD